MLAADNVTVLSEVDVTVLDGDHAMCWLGTVTVLAAKGATARPFGVCKAARPRVSCRQLNQSLVRFPLAWLPDTVNRPGVVQYQSLRVNRAAERTSRRG